MHDSNEALAYLQGIYQTALLVMIFEELRVQATLHYLELSHLDQYEYPQRDNEISKLFSLHETAKTIIHYDIMKD